VSTRHRLSPNVTAGSGAYAQASFCDDAIMATITRWEVRGLLSEACPDLSNALAEEDANLDPGEERLTYLEISAAVRQMAAWLREGKTGCLPPIFGVAERCLLEGDEDAVVLILVGLFEDLQNSGMTDLPTFEVWEPFLGPLSARGWKAVADFWDGDARAIDSFVREQGLR
jgi:hypothetical protein